MLFWKQAEPEFPDETLSPLGLEVTVPDRPVTVRVTWDLPALQVPPPPPQTFGVPPPPQVCGEEQVPQVKVPPQPSEALPQLNPRDEHVAGVQPPGLIVRFALADALLQGADAETVTWSGALTADVESVAEAVLAPTVTVT